jgi:DUF2905 family protein
MLGLSDGVASKVCDPDTVTLRSGPCSERDMNELGKALIVIAVVLGVLGVALVMLGRTNLPLGRLPGDIVYRGKNTTFYFPLATSILLSVVLSIVLYVIGRFRR